MNNNEETVAEQNNSMVTRWLNSLNESNSKVLVLLSVRPNGDFEMNTCLQPEEASALLYSVSQGKDNYITKTIPTPKPN